MSKILDKLVPPTFERTETTDDGKEWGIRVLPGGVEKRVLIRDPNWVQPKVDPKLAQVHRDKAHELRKQIGAAPKDEIPALTAEKQRHEALARYAASDAAMLKGLTVVSVLMALLIVAAIVMLVLS